MGLVLSPGPSPDQTVASRADPAQRPGPLIGRPHRLKQARRGQAGEHPSVKPIGLGAPWCRHPPRVGHQDPCRPALELVDDPARPTGRLQDDDIVLDQAARQQRQLLDGRLDPARRADLAVLADRDLAEVAMDVHPDEAHLHLLLVACEREGGGQTTQTDTCSQHTRAGRRGGHEQRRAHSPSVPRPALRASQEQPLVPGTTASPSHRATARAPSVHAKPTER